MNRSGLDTAILHTLAYAGIFRSGLSKTTLYQRLHTGTPIPFSVFQRHLHHLFQQKKISAAKGYYWKGNSTSIEELVMRKRESERKAHAFQVSLSLITWIPTLQAVAITGSVAVWNAKPTEDIDVLLVTRPGFLWTTRLFVSLLVWGRGLLRRRFDISVQDKWCLNMWLDTTTLHIPLHTLYIAHEVVQATWVFDRSHIQSHFLAANQWIRQYLANTKMPTIVGTETSLWWSLLRIFWVPMELCCFVLQDVHSRPGRTREQVTLHTALFHPRDTSRIVMRKYNSIT